MIKENDQYENIKNNEENKDKELTKKERMDIGWLDVIRNKFEEDGMKGYTSEENFKIERVFFMTIKTGKSSFQHNWKTLDKSVNRILRLAIRSNWKRDAYRFLPIVLGFFEPNGARARRKSGLDIRDNPHSHSLVYFRTQTAAINFKAAIDNESFQRLIKQMDPQVDLECEPYNPDKDTLEGLFDYCSKYAIAEDMRNGGSHDLIYIFPRKRHFRD